jgi:hypothetical protein
MELRDYVQERIGKYTESLRLYKKLVEADIAAGRPVERRKQQLHELERVRNELRVVLYYADTGEEHPDLHPEWTNKTKK